jgi:hypothetical protein
MDKLGPALAECQNTTFTPWEEKPCPPKGPSWEVYTVDLKCKKELDGVFGANLLIQGLCETCLCLEEPEKVNLKVLKTTEGETIQLASDEYPLSFNSQGLLFSFIKKGIVYVSYGYNSGKYLGYAPINLYKSSEKTLEVFNAAKLSPTLVSTQAALVKQTPEGKLEIENKLYAASPCFGESGDGNNEEIKIEFGQGTAKATRGSNGKWTVDFKLDSAKKSGKVGQSAAQMEQQMKAVAEEQLNALAKTGGISASQNSEGFYVAKMNYKEWLQEIGDLGGNVWQNAKLPPNYWNPADGKHGSSKIKMPSLFTGLADGGINMVSDYPQLIKLGYDVATKAEVRSGLWEGVKGISPSSVKDMAEGAMKDKWDKYANASPQVTTHEAGFDAVGVASVLVGGSLIATIAETGKKIKKAIDTKKLDLGKYFDSDDFKDRWNDRWGKYKGALSQDEWLARYKTLIKNREIGKLTEEQFELLEGGIKPKKGITTSDGKRYFDNVLDGTAREVKSGPVTLSKYKDQILKDIEILKQDLTEGKIRNIEWHCFDEVDKIEIDKFVKQELGNKSNLFKIIQY